MPSLEAPSAWRPPTSGVPVPVPVSMPVPAPSRVNPAPPAYGGGLQPPPYQNPTLQPGQPPYAAPRLGQPPFAAPQLSTLAPAGLDRSALNAYMAPPAAIQPPPATQQVVQPPPLLINLDPTSPNLSAVSSNSSTPQRGAGPADLMSFKRGTRASPLDWTSQFATPVFPVAAPLPQPANGVGVPYIGGGLIVPPPPQPLPQQPLPPPPPQSQQAVLPPTPRALSPAQTVAAAIQPQGGSKPSARVAPVRAVERLLQQGDVLGAVRLGWAGTEEEHEMVTGRAPACCMGRAARAVLHVPALLGAACLLTPAA